MGGFEIDVVSMNGVCRVALRGEIDISTAPALQRSMAELLGSSRDLVVDLRELGFIDSTGVRTILRADAQMRSAGGSLRLVPGPPGIQRVLSILGVLDHLEFTPPEPRE